MKTLYLFRSKLALSLSLAVVLSLLIASLALADQVVNNIDTTIDPDLESRTITSGGSTEVGFYVQPSNTIPAGDTSGCNATGANPATVNLSVPAGVTASSASLTFKGCGIVENVTFSSSTVGNHTISVASVSGGKSGSLWDTAPAAFTLIVNPPSDTTPPVITPIVGGTLGDNVWYVSDVTVSWTVTDPESGIASSPGCGSTTLSTETAGTPLTCSATNGVGLYSSETVTIKIDKTGPSAALAVKAGTAGANGWYTSNVTVSTSGTDSISSPVSCTSDQFQTTETAGEVFNGSCTNDAGLSTNAAPLTVKLDKTGPSVVLAVTAGTAGANGWYTSDVKVSTSGTDSISSPVSCTPDQFQTTETTGEVFNGSCTNDAGLSTDAALLTVKLDKTPPTFGDCPAGGPFKLGSGLQSVGPISVNADISGLDAGLSTLYGSVDTSSIGAKSVSFTAVDNASNSATNTSCSYKVIYNWTGFFRPVDILSASMPTLNQVKAGQAIPVKFSLSGNQGLDIFTTGFPRSMSIACDSTASVDPINETVTAGGSSLSYDPLADQYVYVWKTDKAWANTCRQLVVQLNDGKEYRANFKFTK